MAQAPGPIELDELALADLFPANGGESDAGQAQQAVHRCKASRVKDGSHQREAAQHHPQQQDGAIDQSAQAPSRIGEGGIGYRQVQGID